MIRDTQRKAIQSRFYYTGLAGVTIIRAQNLQGEWLHLSGSGFTKVMNDRWCGTKHQFQAMNSCHGGILVMVREQRVRPDLPPCK